MALRFRVILIVLIASIWIIPNVLADGLLNIEGKFVLPFSSSKKSGEIKTDLPKGSDTIIIANFNIQVFGKAKVRKTDVMVVLAKTISQFDIVAVQEIRDASGTAIKRLEDAVDAMGTDYSYIIGPRLGRTSSKEQYAYMFNKRTISVGEFYTFDDQADFFHRDPFIASFSTNDGRFDFVLITIHTDPDDATREINTLPVVVRDAQNHFPDERDFIVLGDLNADCTYFNEDDQASPLRNPEFMWLITNDMDTNLAESSCTYDRIIMTGMTTTEDYAGQSGVFRFDKVFGLTCQSAFKFDPPSASKNDPPEVIFFKSSSLIWYP